jgi:hypothetical protein
MQMTKVRAITLLAAKWLVVLTASLAVLHGTLLASERSAPKTVCSASCAQRCPCCISKPVPARTPAPLAPSSSRLAVEKNFQLAPVIAVLLWSHGAVAAPVPVDFSVQHFSVSLPVFVRHCAFLI